MRDQARQRLWCWGDNASKEASGSGTNLDLPSPTQVGSDKWLAVAPGFQHSCGIQVDGTLWCWGSDSDGQLGDGRSWRANLVVVP